MDFNLVSKGHIERTTKQERSYNNSPSVLDSQKDNVIKKKKRLELSQTITNSLDTLRNYWKMNKIPIRAEIFKKEYSFLISTQNDPKTDVEILHIDVGKTRVIAKDLEQKKFLIIVEELSENMDHANTYMEEYPEDWSFFSVSDKFGFIISWTDPDVFKFQRISEEQLEVTLSNSSRSNDERSKKQERKRVNRNE